MENEKQQLEALHDIRKMMKESSKFLSLSGLSGVFAGIYALVGAYFGRQLIMNYPAFEQERGEYTGSSVYQVLLFKIAFICAAVLGLSIATALIFSSKKARKNGEKLFDHTSKKLVWHMIVPLAAGGVFCLALLTQGSPSILFISPAMLIFYGLALVNASKFTMSEIRYLGYTEIVLGMLAGFNLGAGLLFWSVGFGLVHIIYGSIMWFKYDRA